MLIAIPSMGRPGRVKSQKFITSASVFVPELEVESYRKMGGHNVVSVPMTVKGITQTRNWILDNADDKRVVFIDDDLEEAGWIEFLPHRVKYRRLSENETVGEWVKLFEVTEQLGYRIWGVATQKAPYAVFPWRPFIFHTYVTASCMGILNDGKTRFDESFHVKEDYELCLRCIKEDGGIVGARHLYWENEHWVNKGGCTDYRTQGMEEEAIRRLIFMYPGLIRRIARVGSKYSIKLEFG